MSISQELKNSFSSYWHYLPLRTACQLGVFDLLWEGPLSLANLAEKLGAKRASLQLLLAALEQLEALTEENGQYILAKKGAQLAEEHPKSLKYACLLWGEEHLRAWQHLAYSVLEDKPAFDHIYGQPFFDYLDEHPESNRVYHLAMNEYARDDYANLAEQLDLSEAKAVMDLGGGLGALLKDLARVYPGPTFYLLDKPKVLALLPAGDLPFRPIPVDFFAPIPQVAEHIFLARVLHDWPDEAALKILENVYAALPKGGRLYILEILKEQLADGAELLSLNMLAICKSQERTLAAYRKLAEQTGFIYLEKRPLNDLQSILIFEKR
ncbi:O-methyltransferase [Saprospira grandis DSM 2844]|uniref:O-methyltransferase n=1 Tax=Saprospira grandis DSM 2844 TaxID=694433 RepID=J0XUF0_9BACT|nr:methyltransferase [Saprospira grandis]EJF52591.1 O-methyltransferase [Saprospira grandis DSM 2844]